MRKNDIKVQRKLKRPQHHRQLGAAIPKPKVIAENTAGRRGHRRRHYDHGGYSDYRYYDDGWFWAPYMLATGPYAPTLAPQMETQTQQKVKVKVKVTPQSPLEILSTGSTPLIIVGAVLLWLFARK